MRKIFGTRLEATVNVSAEDFRPDLRFAAGNPNFTILRLSDDVPVDVWFGPTDRVECLIRLRDAIDAHLAAIPAATPGEPPIKG